MPDRPVTAEALFTDFFLPLYPKDARGDLASARATDANPANNPQIVAHIADAARIFVAQAGVLFGADLELDGSDASIHRLSAALTRERRDAWMADGAGTPESTLFNVVVHGAAYVGGCVAGNHGGVWSIRRPLWESVVRLKSRAGEGDLTVFHWWLKSLADDALAESGTRLADRYRTHVEIACANPEALARFADPEASIPRIDKPRHRVFCKYLTGHLPELAGVGDDFPSEERFDELGFRWIDFIALGEGRMVLAFGLGRKGLHLFWFTAKGFEKGAFFPADVFPEPRVRLQADKLQISLSVGGSVQTQEMLWWGP